MAVFISQSDDRVKPKGNHEQARARQHSHHTILLEMHKGCFMTPCADSGLCSIGKPHSFYKRHLFCCDYLTPPVFAVGQAIRTAAKILPPVSGSGSYASFRHSV